MSLVHTFDHSLVEHIATLAGIPVTAQEAKTLAEGFVVTIEVVNRLAELDTSSVELVRTPVDLESSSIREDIVNEDRMFVQGQALQNAPSTHNGYIVVPQVREEK